MNWSPPSPFATLFHKQYFFQVKASLRIKLEEKSPCSLNGTLKILFIKRMQKKENVNSIIPQYPSLYNPKISLSMQWTKKLLTDWFDQSGTALPSFSVFVIVYFCISVIVFVTNTALMLKRSLRLRQCRHDYCRRKGGFWGMGRIRSPSGVEHKKDQISLERSARWSGHS